MSIAEETVSDAWRNEDYGGAFANLPGCCWERRDETGAQMGQALCEAACSNQVRGRFQLMIKEGAIQSECSNLRSPP